MQKKQNSKTHKGKTVDLSRREILGAMTAAAATAGCFLDDPKLPRLAVLPHEIEQVEREKELDRARKHIEKTYGPQKDGYTPPDPPDDPFESQY